MVLGLWNSAKPFKDQKYDELKKQAIDSGKLFEDPIFPADDSSLAYSQRYGAVQWKRPKDLCDNPHMFVEGASAGDVTQGSLGNCWFVAASSSLAQEKALWKEVIPDHNDQDWDENKPENYAGIFHFRFWRFGDWIDVVIDDRLPTINGQLVFIHSQSRNEFWSALLEKAYAKLSGCYEALDGGNLSEALEDFTGGVAETISLQEDGFAGDDQKQYRLFKTMEKEAERLSLMACAIAVSGGQEIESRTNSGLVRGHAYGITAVKKIYLGDSGFLYRFTGKEKLYMVRMRNPWGEKEWNGAFSDNDPEWNNMSEAQRQKLGMAKEDDGEFWMTMEDFCKNFTDVSICRLINTQYLSLHKKWFEAMRFGSWTGNLMGGCINNRSTFLQNPQFKFEIGDDEDEILLSLTQKDVRDTRAVGGQNLPIGFFIMKVELNRKYRLHTIHEKAGDSVYARSRCVFLRITLKKGTYVLVPSTFEANQTGDFMLRVFTSSTSNCKELVYPHPQPGCFACLSKSAQGMSIVTVVRARGLEKLNWTNSGGTFICENNCPTPHQCHLVAFSGFHIRFLSLAVILALILAVILAMILAVILAVIFAVIFAVVFAVVFAVLLGICITAWNCLAYETYEEMSPCVHRLQYHD
ncbi:PREDICTED: calpain-5-like isoform X2 [Priapulus caudatus]|uniref:Calpain-5-like isoform X2 n=1 Tax=Priapulus caudatus TaxID=37621 RepID=A0ABM1DX82_PRICU|nr:PREDICTED: calpain-5-like isoform X2 [Priapulus caudatus]